MSSIGELCNNIEPELLLDDLGVDYRRTTGRSGDQLNVRECPRCHGNKWKVFLNAETGLGNCFHGSCAGEPGFNIYSFAEHTLQDKKQTVELLKQLAGDAGWRPKRKKIEPEKEDWSQQELTIPASVQLPYKGKVGRYLEGRGFSVETVEHFQWRYCSDGYYSYPSENGFRKQDYSKRILIPIYDLNGNLVTFQGRDITGDAEKKYLFPPGLPGTSLYLYNGQNAIGKEEIVVNEGALDVAATHQAFQSDPLLRDVVPVGTFGKVLSMGRAEGDDQLGAVLQLKQKGLKHVVMMWDSEKSALKAAAKAALELVKHAVDVSVAILPKGCDPNEADEIDVRDAYRNAVRIKGKTDYMRFVTSLT